MRSIALIVVLSVVSLVGCTAEPEAPVATGSNRGIRSMQGSTHSLAPRSKGLTASRSDDSDKAPSGAKAVLDKAIAAAKASERNLFVHFGAPW